MTKGRITTQEERVEIVSHCIANGKDYGSTIEKYHVSYQQIYSWVKKYEEGGVNRLVDKRGKRKSMDEMTEIERLRAENQILRAENQHKEMVITYKKSEGSRREGGASGERKKNLYIVFPNSIRKTISDRKYAKFGPQSVVVLQVAPSREELARTGKRRFVAQNRPSLCRVKGFTDIGD
jgi:transposase-like protein